MRKQQHTTDRARIKDLLRLKRDLGSFRHSGDWLRQATRNIMGRTLIDRNNARTIKILAIVAIFDLVYISSMACTQSSATVSSLFEEASDNFKDPTLLYFLFWLPSFAHLLSIQYFLSNHSKRTSTCSVIFGVFSLVWHIICCVYTFTKIPDNPDAVLAAKKAELAAITAEL